MSYKNLFLILIGILIIASCVTVTKSNIQTFKRAPEVSRELSSYFEKNNNILFFESTSLDKPAVLLKKFDLNKDILFLKEAVDAYISFYEQEKEKKKQEIEKIETKYQFISYEKLEKPYNQFDLLDKGVFQGVKKIRDIIEDLLDKTEYKEEGFYKISQLASAIFNNFTPPIKNEYEILALPIILMKQFSFSTIDQNNKLSTVSLTSELSKEFVDVSDVDPHLDLYISRSVSYNPETCEYYKSKRGYGVHPGFQIKCDDKIFKVKFGNEIYSGPFNSRIYDRMGYHVPSINYVSELKIKYDRKIFQEYNERTSMIRKVTFAFQKIATINDKMNRDPFSEVKEFILKDGSIVKPNEMKQKLLKKFQKYVKILDEDINTEYEEKIDRVVFNRATITLKDPDLYEVGPWKADDLNYSRLKEVRGLMVLSAWVGNYDMRKDNLRLFIEKSADKKTESRIRIGFGDVGSGLGRSIFNLKKMSSSDVENMAWEVSQTYKGNGEISGPMGQERIQLTGLMNIEFSKSFQNMNLIDAQWMLGKICSFSQNQLKNALMATGMNSSEMRLTLEKLNSRRNKMLEDFQASSDLKNACFVKVNQKLNYNPEENGLIEILLSNGKKISAPQGNAKIVHGHLVDIEE